MNTPIIIGVAPGVQIILRADGSAESKGPPVEEVLRYAEIAVENLQRWIRLTEKRLDEEKFEQAVERAVEARMAPYEKSLPGYARDPVESEIREQERAKRKGSDSDNRSE